MTASAPIPSFSRRTVIQGAGAASVLAALASSGSTRAGQATQPVTTHPRLWLTEDALPRIRTFASEDNPLWMGGILPLLDTFEAQVASGVVPAQDDGAIAWAEYPTENYAQFFAFLYLIHPDEAARARYGEIARDLLMFAINEAAKGVAEGEPFRDPYFSVFDRSRWWGAGFPLTVDWIYPLLSAEDKATIREVFLRWIAENEAATVTGDANHPQPEGLVNDPALLEDTYRVRWAGNNYFTAHMRNIGLMAMALDPEDDPDGSLTGALGSATGAWLYMVDALLKGDSRGGLTAEGFEYTPLALSYVTQFLLALHTAGQDDPATWGPQVEFTANPFWNEVIPALLHSFSPAPGTIPGMEYLAPMYFPAWYGDGETYVAPDTIGLLGPLGYFDDLTGNTERLEAIRWIQWQMQAGGQGQLLYRLSSGAGDAHIAIFYFLLFDPTGQVGDDPRSSLPLEHLAEGIGRVLARTSWEEDATWFTYALGWSAVDHQHADGNQVEFYRQGEWLTKERTGYGFNIGSSDYHNTLALQNDQPDHFDPSDYRYPMSLRGSQWMIVAAGDPEILALDLADDYLYAHGDATNLYNSEVELSTDIVHASRAVVWLKPDHIVIYDRAVTHTDGRFKRFWLNFPAEATVDGSIATITTPNGQQLAVTTLLPTDAEITAEVAEPLEESGEVAAGELMTHRLRVEAPGGPADVRFLHVLQGADGGTAPDAVTLIESEEGTPFAGVAVAGTAVLFPVDVDAVVESVSYTAPDAVRHLITGLEPGSGWDIAIDSSGRVTIAPGSAQTANDAGVLDITS